VGILVVHFKSLLPSSTVPVTPKLLELELR